MKHKLRVDYKIMQLCYNIVHRGENMDKFYLEIPSLERLNQSEDWQAAALFKRE